MVFGHEQKTLQKQSRNKEFRLVLQQNNEGSFLGFCIMIYVFLEKRMNLIWFIGKKISLDLI